MPAARKIDINEMRNVFSYNPLTGDLTWLERGRDMFKTDHAMKSFNNKKAGKIAHSKRTNKNGKTYLIVKHGGLVHLSHRLCFAIYHGIQPLMIDHINGDGTDNREENLRSVSVTDNNRNMRIFRTNTSGFVGVSKFRGRWQAIISDNDKQINLGVYDTKQEAVAARFGAEKALGYHLNHGEKRPL